MTVFMPSDQVETFRASRLMKSISKSRTDAAFEEGCVKPKNINRSSKKGSEIPGMFEWFFDFKTVNDHSGFYLLRGTDRLWDRYFEPFPYSSFF